MEGIGVNAQGQLISLHFLKSIPHPAGGWHSPGFTPLAPLPTTWLMLLTSFS